MRFVCPSIPILYALLLWQCGPFQMGDWLKCALMSVVQFVVGKRFYVAAWRALRNGSTNMDLYATSTKVNLHSVEVPFSISHGQLPSAMLQTIREKNSFTRRQTSPHKYFLMEQ